MHLNATKTKTKQNCPLLCTTARYPTLLNCFPKTLFPKRLELTTSRLIGWCSCEANNIWSLKWSMKQTTIATLWPDRAWSWFINWSSFINFFKRIFISLNPRKLYNYVKKNWLSYFNKMEKNKLLFNNQLYFAPSWISTTI